MAKLDYAMVNVGLIPGYSGDMGKIRFLDDHMVLLSLVDILGHGPQAHEVTHLIEPFMTTSDIRDPSLYLMALHDLLKGTRGAVGMVCLIDLKTGLMYQSGIGNITLRVVSSDTIRGVSKDGILGYGHIHPLVKTYSLLPGDIILMYSDGLQEYFDLYEAPDIWYQDAHSIATTLIQDYGKSLDDKSCIVVKYNPLRKVFP